MAARATSRVDGYTNQTLRATADVELLKGPDYWVTTGPASGGSSLTPYWGVTPASNARLIVSRWPVLQVTQVQICPNNLWPRKWTTLPAGFAEPEVPPLTVYGSVSPGGSAEGGQGIIVGGGYINKRLGRNGWAILVTYLNGWPHCSLTAAASAGDSTVSVNDCTGWAITDYYGVTGATGRVVDSGQQEAVHVTAASAAAGPGTLTLSSPLNYPHQAGVLVTAMPASVEQACIYFCTAEALTRGATSTTIHAVGGAAQSSSGGARELIEEGELLIHAFKRTLLRSVVRWPQQATGRCSPAPRARPRCSSRRTGRSAGTTSLRGRAGR